MTTIGQVLDLHRRRMPAPEIAAACLTTFQRVEQIIRDLAPPQLALREARRPPGKGARRAPIDLSPTNLRDDTSPMPRGASRNGHDAQFGDQCVHLLPHLRRFAWSLTRDDFKAEDLVQDTILRALKNQHQFSPGTDLRAWLFTIMRNHRMSDIRHAVRRGVPIDLSEAPVAASGGQQASEDAYAVRRALAQMPEKKRIAVLLADCHELTYREIVDTLKIPIGTVRSRVARGRQLMRALIEGQCPCSRKAKTPAAR